MQLRRVYAVFARHFLLSIRELQRIIDLLYWPFFDIMLWGFTAVWLQDSQKDTTLCTILLTNLVFWQVVGRAHMEISLGLIEELWSHNMINLFATPLLIREWLMALLSLSVVKSLFTLLFGATLTWVLYGISIDGIGFYALPFFVLLMMCGWCLGILTIAILISVGQRAQSIIWVINWIATPFSGVFYPIAILPLWAQKISYCLPTTYLFEAIRELITNGSVPSYYWYTSISLIMLYGILFFGFFLYMFHKSKKGGLAKLQVD